MIRQMLRPRAASPGQATLCLRSTMADVERSLQDVHHSHHAHQHHLPLSYGQQHVLTLPAVGPGLGLAQGQGQGLAPGQGFGGAQPQYEYQDRPMAPSSSSSSSASHTATEHGIPFRASLIGGSDYTAEGQGLDLGLPLDVASENYSMPTVPKDGVLGSTETDSDASLPLVR